MHTTGPEGVPREAGEIVGRHGRALLQGGRGENVLGHGRLQGRQVGAGAGAVGPQPLDHPREGREQQAVALEGPRYGRLVLARGQGRASRGRGGEPAVQSGRPLAHQQHRPAQQRGQGGRHRMILQPLVGREGRLQGRPGFRIEAVGEEVRGQQEVQQAEQLGREVELAVLVLVLFLGLAVLGLGTGGQEHPLHAAEGGREVIGQAQQQRLLGQPHGPLLRRGRGKRGAAVVGGRPQQGQGRQQVAAEQREQSDGPQAAPLGLQAEAGLGQRLRLGQAAVVAQQGQGGHGVVLGLAGVSETVREREEGRERE